MLEFKTSVVRIKNNKVKMFFLIILSHLTANVHT